MSVDDIDKGRGVFLERIIVLNGDFDIDAITFPLNIDWIMNDVFIFV